MKIQGKLAGPGYLMAAVLILLPATDLLSAVWPLEPREVVWRYSAVGAFNRTLLTPLLGLFLAYVTAGILEHRAVLLTLAALSALGALLIAGTLSLFVLDASEMRMLVAVEAADRFQMSLVTTAFRSFLALVVTMMLSFWGWRLAGSLRRRRQAAKTESATLVMDSPGARS